MADHGQRAHATWSASSTDRYWNCPGSLTLINALNRPEKESEAAAWGTACHQISEKCLREGRDAIEFIDRIEKTKEYSFAVDEEMAECAQVYIDYVRERGDYSDDGKTIGWRRQHWIEQRFSLSKLNPPFDAGGTADAVIYFPAEKLLEVIDLKGGRGVVVEAKGNPQLRTYALGAMLAFPGLDVDRVKVTIVQPRAAHKDGRIRSEDFHVVDLMEWTADLLVRMEHAKMAECAFSEAPRAAWNAEFLSAGSHCKFCKAAPCAAQDQKVMDAAGVWFDDLDQPKLANAPDKQSPEMLAQSLDLADMIEDWIKATRALAHTQAEMGTEIPGYILVPKQGREKWAEDADAKVIAAAKQAGLDEDKYVNPGKLKTPKQVRKALGKEHEKLVDGLSVTPSEGTNLVRADKTNRAPATPKAQQFFTVLD